MLEAPEETAPQFDQYMYQGITRWVRHDLSGRHKEHCLCHACEKFKPEELDENCEHAQMLFDTARLFHMVIAVWECPGFVERTEDEVHHEAEGPEQVEGAHEGHEDGQEAGSEP